MISRRLRKYQVHIEDPWGRLRWYESAKRSSISTLYRTKSIKILWPFFLLNYHTFELKLSPARFSILPRRTLELGGTFNFHPQRFLFVTKYTSILGVSSFVNLGPSWLYCGTQKSGAEKYKIKRRKS